MTQESAPPRNLGLATFGTDRLLPRAYRLDLSQVGPCQVELNGERLSFVEALRRLQNERVKAINRMVGVKREFTAENGTRFVLSVPPVDDEPTYPMREYGLLHVLTDLVDLAANGVDIDRATWFYYDLDWSQDADVSHSFFVFHNEKVVDERCVNPSWNPVFLKMRKEDEPIWHSQAYFDEAFERYCYRKFYSETITGQLMVLRPDEPILYNFERQQPDVLPAVTFVTLRKIYYILWVTIVLMAGIAFPSLGIYTAIAAIILIANLLLFSWTTRKVGST